MPPLILSGETERTRASTGIAVIGVTWRLTLRRGLPATSQPLDGSLDTAATLADAVSGLSGTPRRGAQEAGNVLRVGDWLDVLTFLRLELTCGGTILEESPETVEASTLVPKPSTGLVGAACLTDADRIVAFPGGIDDREGVAIDSCGGIDARAGTACTGWPTVPMLTDLSKSCRAPPPPPPLVEPDSTPAGNVRRMSSGEVGGGIDDARRLPSLF
jgi:hypothetical protein